MPKHKTPKPDKKDNAEESDDYISELAAAADEHTEKEEGNWVDTDYSGQLAVDVYEDDQNNIIIRAAIAGVRAEDIDITVNDDMVAIKGIRRVDEEDPTGGFLYQECYWGGFSRTIILPTEVDAEKVKAGLKNGILRVSLPKIPKPDTAPIEVVDEDES